MTGFASEIKTLTDFSPSLPGLRPLAENYSHPGAMMF
jgi:hypothetical protein